MTEEGRQKTEDRRQRTEDSEESAKKCEGGKTKQITKTRNLPAGSLAGRENTKRKNKQS
jgi:hypothetical protein